MNRRFLYVLAFLMVAALPLIIFSEEKTAADDIEKAPGFFKMRGSPENGFLKGLMPLFRLADEFNLTNPQLIQLRMLYQKNCQSGEEKVTRNEFFKKLSDPSLNEEEVRKLASEAAKATENEILRRFRMVQEIKKILTPDQLKKLEEWKVSQKGGFFMNGHRRGNFKGMHNIFSKGGRHGFGHGNSFPPPPPPPPPAVEDDEEMTP